MHRGMNPSLCTLLYIILSYSSHDNANVVITDKLLCFQENSLYVVLCRHLSC